MLPITLDFFPWSHEAQAEAPLALPYFPAAQGAQRTELASGPKDPAAQVSQASDTLFQPVPAAQEKHADELDAPRRDHFPVEQKVHCLDVAVAENLPGSHFVHGVGAPAAENLVPMLVEYWPAGHWQELAPVTLVVEPGEEENISIVSTEDKSQHRAWLKAEAP